MESSTNTSFDIFWGKIEEVKRIKNNAADWGKKLVFIIRYL